VRYLSAADVWDIHLEVADQAQRLGKPFDPVCRDDALLESAVGQPRQSFDGADLYPSVFEKAAVLSRGIICSHVFLDGNKRTGLAAAALFLQYNGYDLNMGDEDLVDLALGIAGAGDQGKEPISVGEAALRLKQASRIIVP
jgi:death-on-curing protein